MQVTRRFLPALLAAALLVAGCGGSKPPPDVVVGAGSDAESAVLAELYAAALRYRGAPARVARMPDPVAGLDSGEVAVVPGFTGRLLQRFAPGATAIEDEDVYRAMVAALPEGIAAGDYATATEDKPAVAVANPTAEAWGGRDLAALVRHCSQLTTGSVAGTQPPAQVGGCKLPAPRVFRSDAELFDALKGGQMNAAWTSTADPEVPEDVVVLADRDPALVRAENVVPLYRRNELSEPEVLALNEIAGEFDTSALADMRRQVAQGADPRQVADGWLAAHPLGR
ncbi:MAG: glycine betaine ABC transporter substrate-binding protein [Mycobacterium sp.]